MSDVLKAGGKDLPSSNIVEFGHPRKPKKHEAPFTDSEMIEIRDMMVKFRCIVAHCPAAMRILGDSEL